MSALFFYLFSALILGGAAGVFVSRNSVTSAFSLLGSLLGTAGLFVLLDAYLLAALMVLVYAGAVVALFVFVVMLVGMQGGEQRLFASKASPYAASAGLAMLLWLVFTLFVRQALPAAPVAAAPAGSLLKEYGYSLFTTYLLPVQIAGFLLLIAMVGVIVLSRNTKEEPAA